MNDNFRELLGVVAVLVLVVSLVNVVSVLFLVFTGTSTSIWIFSVPSRNVNRSSTSQSGSAQRQLHRVGQDKELLCKNPVRKNCRKRVEPMLRKFIPDSGMVSDGCLSMDPANEEIIQGVYKKSIREGEERLMFAVLENAVVQKRVPG